MSKKFKKQKNSAVDTAQTETDVIQGDSLAESVQNDGNKTSETAQPVMPSEASVSPEETAQPVIPSEAGVSPEETAENNDRESAEAVQPVVKIEGLYKKYSKKAEWAIENITFSCYAGEIVGLLGHNGAGKSTTLKCLESMLPFDKGTIEINGYNIKTDPLSAKMSMGFVTDNHAVFLKMTGVQYISFMADVYKVPTQLRKERLTELENVFQLGSAINNLISSYSHGMRQKICMMASLIHRPKLWILDEPMTGLDPRTMHAVQEYMKQYASAGNCILFSSHALYTVQHLCDRVVLLKKGEQVNDINFKEMIEKNPDFNFEEYFLENE